MNRYTITLKSGRQLTDLTLNGSMFVSQEALAKEDLSPEELSEITVMETHDSGSHTETVLTDQVCDAVLHWPEGYLFNLRDEDPRDRAVRLLREDTETALNELLDFVLGGAEV